MFFSLKHKFLHPDVEFRTKKDENTAMSGIWWEMFTWLCNCVIIFNKKKFLVLSKFSAKQFFFLPDLNSQELETPKGRLDGFIGGYLFKNPSMTYRHLPPLSSSGSHSWPAMG